jgi:hypothetical protein
MAGIQKYFGLHWHKFHGASQNIFLLSKTEQMFLASG